MKNKKMMRVVLLTAGVLALAGCGKGGDAEGNATSDVAATEELDVGGDRDTSVNTAGFEVFDYDVKDYVKLGDYKGLNVQYPVPTVTDEDVEMEASALVDENIEYNEVDRAAKKGDSVNIDYIGTIDGEEFDGGSEEAYDLILGEGEFLEDFENGIIGKKAGETVTVKTTFPDDYYEDIAGKDAEFVITVNSVSEVVTPEYTDAFVAEVTDYDTIEAYEDSLREELMITAQEEATSTAAEDALLLAVEKATVNGYPQKLYDALYQDNEITYQSYAEMFGMEFEDFMTDFMGGETLESLTETAVKEFLVTQAIAETEGFMLTEKNYSSEAEALLEEYGYETVKDLETDYGKFSIITSLLRDKTLNFLYESANVEEVSESEYYGEDELNEVDDTEVQELE